VLDQIDADIVVTLEPTNPFNRAEYIDDCITGIRLDGCDSCCCVTLDYGFFMDELEKLFIRPMKENVIPKLRETGCCWATRVATLKETNNRLGGKIGVNVIPKWDSLHLDDLDDWQVAEALLKRR